MEASDNERREREILREWEKKAKVPGDYHWKKVQEWTGGADYSEADHGEAPQGARW